MLNVPVPNCTETLVFDFLRHKMNSPVPLLKSIERMACGRSSGMMVVHDPVFD